MSEQTDINAAWKRVQELLREGEINRSLWDAAETAKPLALEDDVLVLGFVPGQMRQASYLTADGNRPQMNTALEGVFGRRMRLETIEGADPGAWEREKQRRETLTQKSRATLEARQLKGSRVIWAELYEEIGKLFGTARERRFAINRARTLVKALDLTLDAEDRARAEEPDNEDAHFQQLNRTIDRIATFAELPASMVAVEYMRLRAARG